MSQRGGTPAIGHFSSDLLPRSGSAEPARPGSNPQLRIERAPHSRDMLDHQLGAACVTDEWTAMRGSITWSRSDHAPAPLTKRAGSSARAPSPRFKMQMLSRTPMRDELVVAFLLSRSCRIPWLRSRCTQSKASDVAGRMLAGPRVRRPRLGLHDRGRRIRRRSSIRWGNSRSSAGTAGQAIDDGIMRRHAMAAFRHALARTDVPS
jgi:hypothetical protein